VAPAAVLPLRRTFRASQPKSAVEKRVPLALFLCFLAIIVFNLTQPPPPRPVADGLRSDAPEVVQPTLPPELLAAPDRVAAEAEETVAVEFGTAGEPGYYRATFSNRGARLLQLELGTYVNSRESPLGAGTFVRLLESVAGRSGGTGSLVFEAQPSAKALFPESLADALWRMEVERDPASGAATGVVFRYAPGGGTTLEKRVRPVPGRYELLVELTLARAADAPASVGAIQLGFTPAGCVGIEFPDSFYPQPNAVAVGGPLDDLEADSVLADPKAKKAFGPLDVPLPIAAIGAHNKYFAAIARPADEATRASLVGAAFVRHEDEALIQAGLRQRGRAYDHVSAQVLMSIAPPPAGETRTFGFLVYAGPKDETHFVAGAPVHEVVLEEDLSTFSGIGRFLTAVLRTLHDLVGNWGVAIVLLTALIRVVLFPLNRRAQTAMARYQTKMKRIQPKLEELKKRFEKDPQALRQEQAKLMQTEGAFPPLGGCLPIFLQLPVFFGLFAALRTSFDLRQAPFVGWITDLSRPDRLYTLAEPVPVIGLQHLNLLPILMVVLWIAQQKTMPKPTDENALRMQRIMLFMPVVMGLFLYNYAAGLSLYMITQSTFGILEQTVVKRIWPLDDKERPRDPNAGCAPLARRMQEMAEQQQKRQQALQGQRGGKRK
jgi:YidC/Oxa1 family membrane protein insertase